ncbi:hypothetical protein UPYG_G00352200 [Umbra pygmaea]|uniref:EGF-like domain-containing protein n=1 Tax=Umbra pygmaea TaxID=75934 RepID=A0ABD0VYL9_UMBPY
MAVFPTVIQEEGVAGDLEQQACSAQLCHGHGQCVAQGPAATCECILGYRGQFCQDTFNGAISVPLTVGVLAVIVGFIILCFVIAAIRQRVKVKKRAAALGWSDDVEKRLS